jgi:hypothetical protein
MQKQYGEEVNSGRAKTIKQGMTKREGEFNDSE